MCFLITPPHTYAIKKIYYTNYLTLQPHLSVLGSSQHICETASPHPPTHPRAWPPGRIDCQSAAGEPCSFAFQSPTHIQGGRPTSLLFFGHAILCFFCRRSGVLCTFYMTEW